MSAAPGGARHAAKVTLATLRRRLEQDVPITSVTAYDATFARLADAADIDVLIVGDSLGMVVQGHANTLPVTIDDLVYHTSMVARATPRALIVADLPFLADASVCEVLAHAGRLVRAGAEMVKLECRALRHVEMVAALHECGIAVCAHLGMTPQAVHRYGGFRMQGRDPDTARGIIELQRQVVAAGAALVLWEAIPETLASELAGELARHGLVPSIGIGAGPAAAGQVLVLHDVLGISERQPKFSRVFLDGVSARTIPEALAAFSSAVRERRFPERAATADTNSDAAPTADPATGGNDA